MKNILAIVFAIIISFSSLGQEYQKLIKDSVYWDIADADNSYICSNFSEYAPYRFFFIGDTIISGHSYAQSYHYNFVTLNPQPAPNCPPFAIDTIAQFSTYHFIREDTAAKKVFKFDKNTGEEFLLFDFSLQQGDSIYNPYADQNHAIDTVYNITTDDGITRKKFIIGSSGDWFGGYYIEGIGGAHGLFNLPFLYLGPAESGYWTMCVRDFNNNIITGSNYCYDFITSISKYGALSLEISVTPTPVKNKITIKFSSDNQNGKYTFELIKITGETVITQFLDRSESIIQLNDISPGFYIYTIKSNNIILKTGKLIKQ